MSNLKVNTINDASGGSTAVLYGVASPPNSMGFRNRIINGDMRIDQRNAGASVTVNDNVFGVDRFRILASQTSKGTVQRNAGSVTPPIGFSNYLGFTSSSAYSILSSDYFAVNHKIEGFNSADFQWGTTNAATVTLSFRVYSSLTGAFGGALQNANGDRSYPFSYTVSSANTWTTVSVTVPGDSTGTWGGSTNGIGIQVWFGMGVGSTFSASAGSWATGNFVSATGAVSVVGTNGATFYITGVQLEAGSVASPFERRAYGQELALCQRYYQQGKASLAVAASASTINWSYQCLVEMRAVPSISRTSGTISFGDLVSVAFNSTGSTSIGSTFLNNNQILYGSTDGFTGLTAYRSYRHEPVSGQPSVYTLNAEL